MTSTTTDSPDSPGWVLLTAQEARVAAMLSVGATNREIAEHLEVSIKTIDSHRGRVLRKLGLRNNVALVRYALRHGLVTLDATGYERRADIRSTP